MPVNIPQSVHDRIATGGYPPCKQCRGDGVIYMPNARRDLHEPAAHIETDCTSCSGTGYRVPLEDIHIDPYYPINDRTRR